MTLLQWVGTPCGQHGPNTFYKGCKFYKNGKWRVLSRGEFFFLKTSETEPLCIAELQLLWQDDKAVSGGLMLSSSKLYFLPEDTPGGRTIRHGEVSQKKNKHSFFNNFGVNNLCFEFEMYVALLNQVAFKKLLTKFHYTLGCVMPHTTFVNTNLHREKKQTSIGAGKVLFVVLENQ